MEETVTLETTAGLSTAEARERAKKFGPNTIREQAAPYWRVLLPDALNCAITVQQRRSRGRWASHAYSRAPCPSPFLARDACRAWGARRGS